MSEEIIEQRPDWDTYFMDFARVAATRCTCFRNHVGAVIVRDKYVVATGYNGAPSFQKNCREIVLWHSGEAQVGDGGRTGCAGCLARC